MLQRSLTMPDILAAKQNEYQRLRSITATIHRNPQPLPGKRLLHQQAAADRIADYSTGFLPEQSQNQLF
jgi:hypothetical protein